ncbi:hypothetical protein NDU88_009386 [Pleurodeles waltl]|uniref:Uncharacterized protein n=1 Tax=Pleurodeles waltl TaxID=8319 RepID=A0AAV7QXE7_PLEWA|nr:hypothetical protein NDU88_009386 [Pleurodeles waltl]
MGKSCYRQINLHFGARRAKSVTGADPDLPRVEEAESEDPDIKTLLLDIQRSLTSTGSKIDMLTVRVDKISAKRDKHEQPIMDAKALEDD